MAFAGEYCVGALSVQKQDSGMTHVKIGLLRKLKMSSEVLNAKRAQSAPYGRSSVLK